MDAGLFGTKGGTRAYEANDLLMMHFGLGPAFKGDEAAAKNAIAAKLGMTAAELGDVFSISWRPVENSNPGAAAARSAARATMEKQSREHREALAEVLAAGDGKWGAIQGARSVVTDEDKSGPLGAGSGRLQWCRRSGEQARSGRGLRDGCQQGESVAAHR
ncbi:MAG: hypothetical protein IPG96_02120 [Proteobacteria bacterium]|nr:hypothetical protein [Pseudomonadota bacterium]